MHALVNGVKPRTPLATTPPMDMGLTHAAAAPTSLVGPPSMHCTVSNPDKRKLQQVHDLTTEARKNKYSLGNLQASAHSKKI